VEVIGPLNTPAFAVEMPGSMSVLDVCREYAPHWANYSSPAGHLSEATVDSLSTISSLYKREKHFLASPVFSRGIFNLVLVYYQLQSVLHFSVPAAHRILS
jgi:hypothetical protein